VPLIANSIDLRLETEVENKDEDISYLLLSVLDMEEENILKHFEPAFKYIERGRNAGACLVHWYVGLPLPFPASPILTICLLPFDSNAGISRSATIVIAYIMKKFKLSVQDATETVSDVRPQICPNPGFVRQLEQYHVNLNFSGTKKIANSRYTGSRVPPPQAQELSEAVQTSIQSSASETATSAAPSQPQETKQVEEQKMKEVSVEKVTYSCRTCRRLLFTIDDLMPHQVGKHSIAFHKRDKGNAIAADQIVCSSYFLQEPLQWMGNLEESEGKICCAKCNFRVGFWKWDGLQCSCGTWVTPAIQMTKNRVDERLALVTMSVPDE